MFETGVTKMKVYKFTSKILAGGFAGRCGKAMAVMVGTDQKFWVVTLAQMEKLLVAGLEVAS